MVWRSREVETRIAESQEVIYPGGIGVGLDIGVFQAMTLIPAALKASRNPDGARLEDLLSPEAYAKWLVLKKKYMGDDKLVEKRRPMIAAEQLDSAARMKSGLSWGGVTWTVKYIAKNHGIPVRVLPSIEREVEFKGARKMLKAASKLEYADVECLTTNLDRIEPFYEAARVRANAWATGDIEALREESGAPGLLNCTDAAMDTVRDSEAEDVAEARATLQRFDEEYKSAEKEWVSTWLTAAEEALAKNTSTFLVLDIGFVMAPWDAVALLREKGYEVEEPK
jgi:hypothetical protein